MSSKQEQEQVNATNPLLGDKTNDCVAVKNIENDDSGVRILDPAENSTVPVKDKFKFMYIIFLLHGMAILLPWNIFMTAVDYYKEKLDTPESKNANYREHFLFYISIIGQVSNVIMNAVNMFFRTGNPKGRMPYAIFLCALVLIFTDVLAIINTSSWPKAFFITTCISIVINFLGTGIYNTSVFYVASMFPMQYINAIIFGNNISGIFTTLMAIISMATSPNLRIAAIYYFLTGVVLVLTCFVLYFITPRLRFYRYYVELNKRKTEEAERKQVASEQKESMFTQYIVIIKTNWVLLFSIWLCMFSTLTIFPVYQSKIKRSSETFFINNKWYTMILCFLTFNIFVTIGNFLTEFIRKPGPKWIVIPVVLKAVLSILFVVFCNYEPDKRNHVPVLIKNDYIYWAVGAIYPLVSGYLISLLMMYAPKQVEVKYAGTASMLSALILVIGVVTGIQFSRVLEWLVLL